MRALRFVAVAVLAGAISTSVRALDPKAAVTQYGHDVWQTEQGLPQNSIFALAQTPDGYLWAGTGAGLARFDGVRFVVFDSQNSPALRQNHVTALFVDRAGALWIGMDGGGLARLAKGSFTSFGEANGLTNDRVQAILEDREGTLWVGTFDGGLYRGVGGRFSAVPALANDRIRALAEDRDGSLWIATDGRGLLRLKDGETKSLTTAEGLKSNRVHALALDPSGALWIGTFESGLDRLENGRVTHISAKDGLASDALWALYVDHQGTLWVGTAGGGVSRIHAGEITNYTSRDGLSNDYAWSFLEDFEGSLFIGTFPGGLNQLKDGKFTTYTTREGLPAAPVRSVLEDRSGSVWVGTEGGGLARITNGAVDKVLRPRDGLLNDRIYALAEDADGSLWIGSYDGLNRLKDGKLTAYESPAPGMLNGVHAICRDRAGALWLGTFRDGLYRLTVDREAPSSAKVRGRLEPFTTKEGLSNDRILCVVESSDGSLWVGTAGGGLNCIKDGVLTRFGTRDGLSSAYVFWVHEDRDGILWIGTEGGGLARFEHGRFATVSTRQGLPDDVIYAVLEDRTGDLWLTTNKGVFQAKRSVLSEVAAGHQARVSGIMYGVTDGLRAAECQSSGRPVHRGKDGRLWFATVRGVAVIDPARIRPNLLVPPVYVEDVSSDGAAFPIGSDGSITFAPGHERFEIRYTALSLRVPERVRFRYRLEGLETGWTDAGTRRSAYYSRIPHGSYVFRVLACNDDGLWNETGASLSLTIQPRFAETTAFKAVCVAAFVLVLGAVWRGRVHALKTRERQLVSLVKARTAEMEAALAREADARRDAEAQTLEADRLRDEAERQRKRAEEANRAKSTFLANMSHELRTPLNAIIGYSELIEEELASEQREQVVTDLHKIQASARHQLQLVNSILDLSKIEAGKMELYLEPVDLSALVRDVASIAEPLAERNANTLTLSVAEDLGTVEVDHTKLRQSLLNLLSNACKFTEKGRVTLAATRERRNGRDDLVFEVSDTGVGMTTEQLEKLFQPFVQADASTTKRFGGTGLGLVITRRFCQLMGGDVSVNSSVGVGTVFKIQLPARETPSASR